jgi:hypothetical protein
VLYKRWSKCDKLHKDLAREHRVGKHSYRPGLHCPLCPFLPYRGSAQLLLCDLIHRTATVACYCIPPQKVAANN